MLKVLSQVINHTTVVCVNFIVGKLKMIVKNSPRGKHNGASIHMCKIVNHALASHVCTCTHAHTCTYVRMHAHAHTHTRTHTICKDGLIEDIRGVKKLMQSFSNNAQR